MPLLPRKSLVLFISLICFAQVTDLRAQCTPARPLIKRWVVGFGSTADVYNGFHFGLWPKNTQTNGFDFGVVPLLGDSLRSTRANGLAFGLIGLNENRVNGIAFGTLWTNTSRMNGINISPGIVAGDTVNGFCFGAVVSYGESVNGLTAGTLVAYAGHDLNGLAFSPIVAGSERDMNGLAFGGIFVGGSKVRGAQLSLVAARADSLDGMQLASFSITGSLRGLQLGGLNFAGLYAHGLQFGAVNLSGMNTEATYHSDGIQAGLVNKSRSLYGLQLGLVNHTGYMRGFQLGLINVISRNPRWCRVLPLINVAYRNYPEYHRSRLPQRPTIPGTVIVTRRDTGYRSSSSSFEIEMLGSQHHGITRSFYGDYLVKEEQYSHDSLLKVISYTPDVESYGDYSPYSSPERYYYSLESGSERRLYRINAGDTMERTIDGKKEGLWKDPAALAPVTSCTLYQHDSLLDSYWRYTGKTIRYRDKEVGLVELHRGERMPLSAQARKQGMMQYFTYGEESETAITYEIKRGEGAEKQTRSLEFDRGRLLEQIISRHDSTIFIEPKGNTSCISTNAETKWFYRDGILKADFKKGPTVYKSVSYFENGQRRLEELADSAYINRPMTGFRTNDTLGHIYATAYFKDQKVQAIFAWKGSHFNQGKVFWKNGKTRIEAFPAEKKITLYYYKKNGTPRKVREVRYSYGPLGKYLRQAQLAPSTYNGGICN